MSAALRNLGKLVAASRIDHKLTQRKLADLIDPPTNRSVISHLEQGLRLPAADVLKRICELLDMPRSIWMPFLGEGFQTLRTVRRTISRELRSFQMIAIAGPSGSGKTTVARSLARALDVPCLPDDPHPKRYLQDLSTDPGRWAFETQLAFMANKALQIANLIDSRQPFVLDRTLAEDINIYARFYMNQGEIDERSAKTYKIIADHFLNRLPQPDIVLYCEVSLPTLLRRLCQRNRGDELHTDTYIRAIHELYANWIDTHAESLVFSLDAESTDFREAFRVEELCNDLEVVLRSSAVNLSQLTLWNSNRKREQAPLAHLRLRAEPPDSTWPSRIGAPVEISPSRVAPVAYIAAPFTAVAADDTLLDPDALFGDTRPHGSISKGAYREMLFIVERALKDVGLLTILPHRDVNKWGRHTLTPVEGMRKCTHHVSTCDLFVGLLGTSSGAHYEFGLALGLGKPSLVILLDEMPSSFLAQGATGLWDEELLVLSVSSSAELNRQMRSRRVREFLNRFLSIPTITTGNPKEDG